MKWAEYILSVLFPVRLPRIECPLNGIAADPPYDGILWKAYDVRQTGIERFERERALTE